jgi:DNA-binding MarR family transcriptional regulator
MAGLVRRRRDPKNRRRVLVDMTSRGSKLIQLLAAEHYSTIEKLGRMFIPPSR